MATSLFFPIKGSNKDKFHIWCICLSAYMPNTNPSQMIKQSDLWHATAHFLEFNQAHPCWNNCFPCFPRSNRADRELYPLQKAFAQKFAEFSLQEGATPPKLPHRAPSHSMGPATITLTAQTHLQRPSSAWILPLLHSTPHSTPPNITHTETWIETPVYATLNAQFASSVCIPPV